MSRPVTVSIPHSLGKDEAHRRIEQGFTQMRQQMLAGVGGVMSKMFTITDRWEGDQLQFEGSGMGQKMTGRLDVRENAVDIQIDLPDVLAALAEKITGRLKDDTQKLLEKK
jgi:hypothetical protein